MHKVKTTLLLAVISILTLPVIQLRYGLVPEQPLKGYFSQSALPDLKYFTWDRWFSQEFQQVVTKGLNENTGFRNTTIRVRNQYDYTFFGIPHARGFLRGKDRCFYEEDYIHEYTGKYFVGNRIIEKKLARLKNVTDSLRSYNIPLILVFEPGKASFYPENIPDSFNLAKRSISNYEYFSKRSGELGLSCIDLNRHFIQMKDTSKYPLFPRYGMHWSLYGVHLAADTLSRYIETASGHLMPDFTIKSLIHSQNSLGTDYDIGELLNLFWPMSSSPGVYPQVPFDAIPDGNLPALVVADSYYINLVETYGKKMFGKQDYWYYNSSVYPHQNESPPVRADKTNLRDKLKQYGVVLLMVSEINLHCCFWGFADEAYLAFHPEIKDSQLEKIENSIRSDREWFRFMVKKARDTKKPLDQVIRADADYAFLSNYQNIEGKVYEDTLQYFRISLSYNADWIAKVTREAWARGIPVDSMMMIDAKHSYDQSKKKL